MEQKADAQGEDGSGESHIGRNNLARKCTIFQRWSIPIPPLALDASLLLEQAVYQVNEHEYRRAAVCPGKLVGEGQRVKEANFGNGRSSTQKISR